MIGVEIDIKETWKIAEDREKGREIVGIWVEEEEKKKEIWKRKSRLRDRKERILEDVEAEKNEMEVRRNR